MQHLKMQFNYIFSSVKSLYLETKYLQIFPRTFLFLYKVKYEKSFYYRWTLNRVEMRFQDSFFFIVSCYSHPTLIVPLKRIPFCLFKLSFIFYFSFYYIFSFLSSRKSVIKWKWKEILILSQIQWNKKKIFTLFSFQDGFFFCKIKSLG